VANRNETEAVLHACCRRARRHPHDGPNDEGETQQWDEWHRRERQAEQRSHRGKDNSDDREG